MTIYRGQQEMPSRLSGLCTSQSAFSVLGDAMGKIVDFDPQKRRKWKTGRNTPGQRRPPAPQRPAPRRKNWIPGIAIITAIAFFGISQYVPLIPGCDIKGNISYNTGDRIYHLPGQEYYSQTRVNYLDGERWFCSEEAARDAGWRRAYK